MLFVNETLKWSLFEPLASLGVNRMRGVLVKARASRGDRNPGGVNSQESYALGLSLNR